MSDSVENNVRIDGMNNQSVGFLPRKPYDVFQLCSVDVLIAHIQTTESWKVAESICILIVLFSYFN